MTPAETLVVSVSNTVNAQPVRPGFNGFDGVVRDACGGVFRSRRAQKYCVVEKRKLREHGIRRHATEEPFKHIEVVHQAFMM